MDEKSRNLLIFKKLLTPEDMDVINAYYKLWSGEDSELSLEHNFDKQCALETNDGNGVDLTPCPPIDETQQQQSPQNSDTQPEIETNGEISANWTEEDDKRHKLSVNKSESGVKVAEKRYKCLYKGCTKAYTASYNLRLHQIKWHPKDDAAQPERSTIRCGADGCEETFTSLMRLKLHNITRHSNASDSYANTTAAKPGEPDPEGVAECGGGDGQPMPDLSGGPKLYTCFINGCNKQYTTIGFFSRHVKNKHSD